jgi:DNA polymerase-3 subunit delta
MKLKAPQLVRHLQQRGLPPVCLIYGEEPLQEMECADAVRGFARGQGYSERSLLNVEGHFDWSALSAQTNALSLFASRRLVELRLNGKAPNEAGNKALQAYLERPPADTLLLILAGKQDSKAQKSGWFLQADRQGVLVQTQPVDAGQMPGWISQRLNSKGLQASGEALALLAERAEGNLLAAAQEVEKLALLYPQGRIEAQQVLEAVADSARFVVFDWIDTVLRGDPARVVRQLQALRAEGVDAVLIAGLLAREIRNLCQISTALRNGQAESQVFGQYRVWASRKEWVSRALKRHSPARWHGFLGHAARIDRMIKGAASGNAWDEIQRLALHVAGVAVLGGAAAP